MNLKTLLGISGCSVVAPPVIFVSVLTVLLAMVIPQLPFGQEQAWRWLEHPGASQDLAEMTRRFRKRDAGVHLATQHGGDLGASQQAVVIRDRAALTVLFRSINPN